MTVTSALYKMARASATARAARRGPGALVRQQVRRKVYRTEGRATRRTLRRFGL